MKRGLILLTTALLAGLAAFYAMRWHASPASSQHDAALDTMPELEWLRTELDLSDEQFMKVQELHVAYRPKCVEMCARISNAHDRLTALAVTHQTLTPEYRAALREHAAVHVECQEEMLQHLYRTASTLREEQAKRYLKAMLPFVLDFTHGESFHAH